METNGASIIVIVAGEEDFDPRVKDVEEEVISKA